MDLGLLGQFVDHRRGAPGADPINAEVGSDPPQPRPHTTGAQLQPRGIAPKPQHRFLCHVLGLCVVLQHAPGDGENGRQMPVDQATKGLCLAGRDPRQQRGLCLCLGLVRLGPQGRAGLSLAR